MYYKLVFRSILFTLAPLKRGGFSIVTPEYKLVLTKLPMK